MLRPLEPLEPGLTKEVVALLLERHDALRLRFMHGADGWASSLAPAREPVPFEHIDVSGLAEDEQHAAIGSRAAELQKSLHLGNGPLVQVALFDRGGGEQRLLVIIHHFATDGISWRPFWEDFEAVYDSLKQGDPVPPPPTSTPFREWAQALKRRADSDELRADMHPWLDLHWNRVRSIPFDLAARPEDNTNESAREVVLELTVEETRAVFQETLGVPHKVDFLMTALPQVAAGWTGSDTVVFDLMGHGRDEDAFEKVDISDTVGFFTSYTPMVLTVARDQSELLPELLTDQIRPIMRRGLDFDLLRYMTSDPTVRRTFGSLPRAQILFNHLGRRDKVDTAPGGRAFSLAEESVGNTHDPSGVRYYPLAVSSQVGKDQLRVNFVFSENLHARSTVEALAADFKSRLMALVARSGRRKDQSEGGAD